MARRVCRASTVYHSSTTVSSPGPHLQARRRLLHLREPRYATGMSNGGFRSHRLAWRMITVSRRWLSWSACSASSARRATLSAASPVSSSRHLDPNRPVLGRTPRVCRSYFVARRSEISLSARSRTRSRWGASKLVLSGGADDLHQGRHCCSQWKDCPGAVYYNIVLWHHDGGGHTCRVAFRCRWENLVRLSATHDDRLLPRARCRSE